MTESKDPFTPTQRKAIDYFKANLNDWLANPLYRGKYAVIREDGLVGVFDDFRNAYADAGRKYPQGSYIIQRLTEFYNGKSY